ncbi:MAG: hypothetical protein QOH83_2671 [Solirubrobacteraceae bacterium]|jgi:hypothetical protein|nr:hypothetical protein [Solirubrobacteraceae bacterium]
MNFARALIRELVDKRLWPIAVVLLVALLAVPVMLSRGDDDPASDDAPPVADASAGAGATKVPAVTITGPPSVRSRPGQVRDPFRRTPVKLATATTPSSAASAGGGTAAPSAAAPDMPTDRVDTTKTIDVRFGKADNLRRMPHLEAGTELPAGQNGVVRYAGVVAGTQQARFVAVDGVIGKTDGDAKCYGKDGGCNVFDMKAGDKQTFIVEGVNYEIEIVSVPQGAAGNADTPAVPAAPAAPGAKVSYSYYRTTVRFAAGSNRAAARSLSRLTPLPGPSDHALIYIGATSRGAAFLLGSGVTATGEGECLVVSCRIVALERGESTLVDVTPADDGAPRRYTLEAVTIEKVDASATVAKKMRARVNPHGRYALHAMLEDPQAATAFGLVTYDADTGMLEPGPSKVAKVTG